MSRRSISGGVAHGIPADLRRALAADAKAKAAWETLTPLSRNEWICWTISVKKSQTREQHIGRAVRELKEGKRRPCCWMGCIHRTDKAMSPSVRGILAARSARKKAV